jgi:hypothetical protein
MRAGAVDVCRWLLQKGVDVNALNRRVRPALISSSFHCF